jgi:hypothetical protein
MIMNPGRQEVLMDKLRVWPVLLLGLFMASMSGVAVAQGGHGGGGAYSGHGGHGGYYGHGGHGGYYGHSNVGVGVVIDPFWFGFGPGYYARPYYYPPYYYSPYYYPPAVVSAPAEPPVYIERGEAVEPAPQASPSWYYCADPQGYYPYVKQCPGGWQAVAPQPPTVPAEGR